MLTKEKQNKNNNNFNKTKSLSEALTSSVSINKPKNRRVPELVVKKINDSDNTNLENTIMKYLTEDKTIQTKNVISKNKETVIINCINEESVLFFQLAFGTGNFIAASTQVLRATLYRAASIHIMTPT